MSGKRQFGDYQTPNEFADRVCQYLKNRLNIHPTAVVEPTCGLGNLLNSSFIFDAQEYYGIELNESYCQASATRFSQRNVKIIHGDFFRLSTLQLIENKQEILIIGNPPWVTNSTLSALGSANVPDKSNTKGLKGLDAMTGASNFDICEYMIFKLIEKYNSTNATIAMLCKTSVARNIFQELKRKNILFSRCETLEFNAYKTFHVHAQACLLIVQFNGLNNINKASNICHVRDFDHPDSLFLHLAIKTTPCSAIQTAMAKTWMAHVVFNGDKALNTIVLKLWN